MDPRATGLHRLSYSGVTLVAIHILSIVYFTQRVASSLLHSKYMLPVSQDVKLRMAARSQLGWIFGGLALLSLGVAAYANVTYASLSFEIWADERGIGSTPRSVFFSRINISSPDLTCWSQCLPGNPHQCIHQPGPCLKPNTCLCLRPCSLVGGYTRLSGCV